MSWWERLIAEAGRRRAALELSNRWKLPPPDVVARAMASAGVLFSLGSDAHEVEQVGSLDYPLELVREFGIPRERILVPQRKRR
jgi:histidinol phosphatase-like PHP family hydrolase